MLLKDLNVSVYFGRRKSCLLCNLTQSLVYLWLSALYGGELVLLRSEAIIPAALLASDTTAAETRSDDECEENDAAQGRHDREPHGIVGRFNSVRRVRIFLGNTFSFKAMRSCGFIIQILVSEWA